MVSLALFLADAAHAAGAAAPVLPSPPVATAPPATTAVAPQPVLATPPAPSPWRLAERLGSPSWLRLGLEHRTRFEQLQDDFRAATLGNDASGVVMRTLLSAEATLGGGLALGAELQDSRAYSDKRAPLNTTIVNTVELLQGWIGLRTADLFHDGDRFSASAGRLTIDLGSRRLVARNDFRNTINGFTGLDLQWTSAGGHLLRGFAVMPVIRQPTDAAALADNDPGFDEENADAMLYGLFYASPVLVASTRVEAYVLGLDEGDRKGAPSSNRRLATPGMRLLRAPAPGQPDWQLEAMLQAGRSRATTSPTDTTDLDHFAYSLHAGAGYRFASAWTPRAALVYDLASGDGSPNDGDNGRFDPLFAARRFEFGPTSFWGALARANLHSPGVRLEAWPRGDVDAMLSYRAAWLQSDTDAWTTSGLRDPTGGSGSFVGHQVEGRVRWHVIPKNLSLELGAALLREGEFPREASGGASPFPVYFYTQVTSTL